MNLLTFRYNGVDTFHIDHFRCNRVVTFHRSYFPVWQALHNPPHLANNVEWIASWVLLLQDYVFVFLSYNSLMANSMLLLIKDVFIFLFPFQNSGMTRIVISIPSNQIFSV